MRLIRNFSRPVSALFAVMLSSACATLLMLPDELTEEHYRAQAGDIKPQVDAKMEAFPGATFPGSKASYTKTVSLLPFVYLYDTTNTLKDNEEAYYTSKFNNGSGSWIRPFAQEATKLVREQLKARGYEAVNYGNAVFESKKVEQIEPQIAKLTNGSHFKGVAYNADNSETNYAVTNFYDFRKFIDKNEQAIIYMMIRADWEPSSANRLNDDIVLNTSIKLGYEFVVCAADSGCTTIKTPYEKGISTNLFMPNRNTIDRDGLNKNYEIIKSIHGEQLKIIVEAIFKKLDAMGTFPK